MYHFLMFFPVARYPPYRYKILAPQAVSKEPDPKKNAQIILDATGLDAESYRLGHTKACYLRSDSFYFTLFYFHYSKKQTVLIWRFLANMTYCQVIQLIMLIYFVLVDWQSFPISILCFVSQYKIS